MNVNLGVRTCRRSAILTGCDRRNFQYVDTGSRVRINGSTSYAFCVSAMLCGLLFSCDSFRNRQAVKTGVKIAVTMADAATWTVAAAATAAYDGSAIATACGTAAECPPGLEAAPQPIPLPQTIFRPTIP